MKLTLDDIAVLDCPVLTPDQAAPAIGMKPDTLRNVAKTEDGRKGLGFRVVVYGNEVRIPRIPFLAYFGKEVAPNA